MLRQSVEMRDKVFREGSACYVKPILLGVTVLTSMNAETLPQIGSRFTNPEDAVISLAGLAKNSRLDGVVSSVHEAPALRKTFGPDFVLLTPGIRPTGSPTEDQSRTATPSEAKAMGSDYIVVGRPIIKAEDPVAVVEQILHEID
jgi:orotidine-5'-phosphate decarboxylase